VDRGFLSSRYQKNKMVWCGLDTELSPVIMDESNYLCRLDRKTKTWKAFFVKADHTKIWPIGFSGQELICILAEVQIEGLANF